MPRARNTLRLSLLALLVCAVSAPAFAQSRGSAHKPARVKTSKVAVKKQRASKPAIRNVAKSMRAVARPAKATRSRHLAGGLDALFSKKVDGISQPHPDVVKQIQEAAGGTLRGPVYVVRYGTAAAEQVTALTKENGMGLIYKGSAGNGHSMAWVGGKLTDSVPGRFSFGDGAKTRIHEFQPQSERPKS